jgi:Fe-S-cluster containining protein
LAGQSLLKKKCRKLSLQDPNHFRKINGNHYETKTKNGICAYLKKDGLCSIQSLKPKLCWAWPVHLDFRKNKKIYYLMICPLTPHLSEKEIKVMKGQMSDYTKEFIFCNDTKMSNTEVKKVMKKYYKLKKRKLK